MLLTARDNAHTVRLAQERWPDVHVIGGESPEGKTAKARAITRRVLDLRRWASRARPDVALSHNSYAQIVAARSLGIPAVTAMDFEHQPANHLAFRLVRAVLVPEVMPLSVIRRQGAAPRKLVRYRGYGARLSIPDVRSGRHDRRRWHHDPRGRPVGHSHLDDVRRHATRRGRVARVRGMLERLTTPAQLVLGPRPSEPRTPAQLRGRAAAIERAVAEATLAAGR